MSKRVRRVTWLIVSVLLLLYVLMLMYRERYEGAKDVGDALWRIPIGFPYELISEIPFTETRIHKWVAYGVMTLDSTVPKIMRDHEGALNGISRFNVGNGTVCGIREPLIGPFRVYNGPRYVIFKVKPLSIKTFCDDEDFLKACQMYGIDGMNLEDFVTNYNRYWNGTGVSTPWRVLVCLWRGPFSVGEGIILLVCLMFVIVSLIRVCRD